MARRSDVLNLSKTRGLEHLESLATTFRLARPCLALPCTSTETVDVQGRVRQSFRIARTLVDWAMWRCNRTSGGTPQQQKRCNIEVNKSAHWKLVDVSRANDFPCFLESVVVGRCIIFNPTIPGTFTNSRGSRLPEASASHLRKASRIIA